MSWFTSLWNTISAKIAAFIHDSSWLTFAWILITIIIVLLVIGFVGFWWWLLNKALNHGGDH